MKKKLTPTQKLARIRAIINAIGDRCLAVDGPVSDEADEITSKELGEIYKLTVPRKGRRSTP